MRQRSDEHKRLITQAFVLGAGLGTRLRPLTDELPKPLVPIFQKPLITFALDHLIAARVQRFVINTHRLPHMFEQQFGTGSYRGHSVELVNEPQLLETGGGIKNAEPQLPSGCFITYSGDILTDVPLEALIDEHFQRNNDVTLALRTTGFAPSIAFRDGQITNIAKRFGQEADYDFANIAVWSPTIFGRIPPAKKISFIPILIDWLAGGGKIGGFVLNEGKWFNIGSGTGYLEVHRVIAEESWSPGYVADRSWMRPVADTAEVHPSARLQGCTVIGPKCRIEAGAILHDTIVWAGAQIAFRSELHSCIVRAGRMAEGILHEAII